VRLIDSWTALAPVAVPIVGLSLHSVLRWASVVGLGILVELLV
jgi:hypothetical protein